MDQKLLKQIIVAFATIALLIVSNIFAYSYGKKVGNLEQLEFVTCHCKGEMIEQKQETPCQKDVKEDPKASEGIDVSHHQGQIDWALVAEHNPEFVYIKATEGATYTDPRYHENAKGAIDAGLKTGAYHFFRMTSSVEEQFENFTKAIDAYPHQLIPMVDVETADGRRVADLQRSLQKFLDKLEERYGVVPMIYGTNRSYNELCSSAIDERYPLYIGRYGSNAPIVKGEAVYTIWQYSERGSVPGIPKPVDLCRFRDGKGVEDITLGRRR